MITNQPADQTIADFSCCCYATPATYASTCPGKLCFADNNIGCRGADALAEVLHSKNFTLTTLELTGQHTSFTPLCMLRHCNGSHITMHFVLCNRVPRVPTVLHSTYACSSKYGHYMTFLAAPSAHFFMHQQLLSLRSGGCFCAVCRLVCADFEPY